MDLGRAARMISSSTTAPKARSGRREEVTAVSDAALSSSLRSMRGGEEVGVVRGDHVALHDVDGVTALLHVHPRERPPCAADGIEGAAAQTRQRRRAR